MGSLGRRQGRGPRAHRPRDEDRDDPAGDGRCGSSRASPRSRCATRARTRPCTSSSWSSVAPSWSPLSGPASRRGRTGLHRRVRVSLLVPGVVTVHDARDLRHRLAGPLHAPLLDGVVLLAGLLLDRRAPRGPRQDVLVAGWPAVRRRPGGRTAPRRAARARVQPGSRPTGAWVLVPPAGRSGSVARRWARPCSGSAPVLLHDRRRRSDPTREEVSHDRSDRPGRRRRRSIGDRTRVWGLAQVREDAVIGRECTIGRGAYIGAGVGVGDRVQDPEPRPRLRAGRARGRRLHRPAAVLTND